jgi:integrase
LLVEALESAYMRYDDDVPESHPALRRHVRAQLSDLARIPAFLADREVVLAAEGMNRFLDTLEVEFKSACGALRRRSEGNYRPDERAREFPAFTVKAAVEARPAGFTCLELFRAWVAERQPAPATTNRWRSVFLALEREFPKRDVATITEAEARSWRDTLVTDKRSAQVVNGTWLRSAKLVFAWAHADKKISLDPFEKVALLATKAAPPKLRDRDFTDPEWQTILADTLQLMPKRMAAHNAAARRWVPWLSAYSGARAGEMTQLRAEDVKQHKDGFWTMRITPEAGTVKGGQARVVPIHDHVVEQGFIDFVTAKGGTGPLFYDPHGGRVSTAVRDIDNPLRGEWIKARAKLAEWVRDLGINDPNISPTHAWRHTFKRRAARAGVDKRIRWAMCGHSSRDVGDAYETPSVADLYRELTRGFPRYDLPKAGDSQS